MKRYTLSDLIDPANLADWLGHDGNPPVIEIQTKESKEEFSRWCKRRWGYSGRAQAAVMEKRPVADAETAAKWWDDYRRELALDWQKSPANPLKPRTHTQFLAECLSSLGIKGGTVKDRIARAVAARPDLYPGPAAAEMGDQPDLDESELATLAESTQELSSRSRAAHKAWATRRARQTV